MTKSIFFWMNKAIINADCEKGIHQWGKWKTDEINVFQRRSCVHCGFTQQESTFKGQNQ